MRPFFESKPEFRQDIGQLAMALAVKGVLEHLRYELLGRNSFSEQQSAPTQFLCGEHSGDWAGAAFPEGVRGGPGLYAC